MKKCECNSESYWKWRKTVWGLELFFQALFILFLFFLQSEMGYTVDFVLGILVCGCSMGFFCVFRWLWKAIEKEEKINNFIRSED